MEAVATAAGDMHNGERKPSEPDRVGVARMNPRLKLRFLHRAFGSATGLATILARKRRACRADGAIRALVIENCDRDSQPAGDFRPSAVQLKYVRLRGTQKTHQ